MSKAGQQPGKGSVVSLRPARERNDQGLQKVHCLCAVIAAGATATLGWGHLSSMSHKASVTTSDSFDVIAIKEEDPLSTAQIESSGASSSDRAMAYYYAALCYLQNKTQNTEAVEAIDRARSLQPLILSPGRCRYPAPSRYTPFTLVSAVARECAKRATDAAQAGDAQSATRWIKRGRGIVDQVLMSAMAGGPAATPDAIRVGGSIDTLMGTAEETCLRSLGRAQEAERVHSREKRRHAYSRQEMRCVRSSLNVARARDEPDDPAMRDLARRLCQDYATERVRLGLTGAPDEIL